MTTTETLPKDFKKKWVAALRSGEYKQGGGKLYDVIHESYCCLGVACEAVGIKGQPVAMIWDWIAEDKIPEMLIGNNTVPHALASLNDFEIPFEVIAGFIQENL